MEASKNGLVALGDIFLAPRKALQAVKEGKAKLWLPLILLLGSSIGLFAWYFAWVDFDWLKGKMIQDMVESGKTTAAESEQVGKFLQRNTMMIGTLVSVVVLFPLILAVQALYLFIVEKVAGGTEEQGYGRWFSLAWWSSMPALLGSVAGAVAMLTTSNRQLSLEALQVASLNSLIFKLPASDPWAGLLGNITLFSLWSIALIAIGWSLWRNTSMVKGLLVAAAPWLVIWGAMAAFAASK